MTAWLAAMATGGALFLGAGCEQHAPGRSEASARAPSPFEPAQAIPEALSPASAAALNEVRHNILSQPLDERETGGAGGAGNGPDNEAATVADLALPEEFVRRLADRIIRSSFEERFRAVVRDPLARTHDGDQPGRIETDAAAAAPATVRVIDHSPPPVTIAAWRAWPEDRPPLRGFRPALLDSLPDLPPLRFELPANADPMIRSTASLINTRLARDGLLMTTAQAIEHVRSDAKPEQAHDPTAILQVLAAAGLPVDLLAHFEFDGERGGEAIIHAMLQRLERGESIEAMNAALSTARFTFQRTEPSFIAASESGEIQPSLFRAQATRGDDWKGKGDGGNIDMIRQFAAAAPDVLLLVSVEDKHAAGFASMASRWRSHDDAPITVVPEPLPVAQWAQDNAKPGTIAVDDNARAMAAIVPRYCSRRDDGSVFVPGETTLVVGLAEAGIEIVHSPLLFQGGNLMLVTQPGDGSRVLLIGEAEVWRNVSLGLSVQQAMEALRIEFAADRAEIIPAVSFHIDYDFTVRAVDDELIAFVGEPLAAARIIIECAISVMERHGLLSGEAAREARAHLHAEGGGDAACLAIVRPIIMSHRDAAGMFPLSLAERFSTGPVDSGVGNLQRLLLAMDVLAASVGEQRDAAEGAELIYAESLQRLQRARAAQVEVLRGLGMRVIEVPSLGEGGRCVNLVNCLQLSDRMVMPVYGGLYQPVDEAAANAVSAVLGPQTRVIQVRCGESQRRSGGVHCSISAFPKQ